MRVTLLGTGTSHGIPMIGCDCAVCRSDDPRDRRTRTSAWVEAGAARVLIDVSPELRLQCVANDVRRVTAVLLTHAHADHVAGLDDLRRFNDLQKQPLTVYGPADAVGRVTTMFGYAFRDDPAYPSTKPRLRAAAVEGPFDPGGCLVTPLPLRHGQQTIFGYRIGGFAYCTDCSGIPDATRPLLGGIDLLVLGALRHTPHPTHFTLAQAVDAATQIGARQTLFTHIAHELQHAPTNAGLPPGMALAFDGQTIELPDP